MITLAIIILLCKILIEIAGEIDKENRRKYREQEFLRHLQESIRKGQRRN